MTEAEKQELVTALRASADANIISMIAPATRNDNALMEYLNAKANPAVKAWRTSLPTNDADDAPDYSTYDALQAGKRDSWNLFLRAPRDLTRNKVRKWITDVWGSSTNGSNAEAILLAGTENATRAEVMLGGSDASTGSVTALKRDWSGSVSLQELSDALNKY
jgi:hypothetical protein